MNPASVARCATPAKGAFSFVPDLDCPAFSRRVALLECIVAG